MQPFHLQLNTSDDAHAIRNKQHRNCQRHRQKILPVTSFFFILSNLFFLSNTGHAEAWPQWQAYTRYFIQDDGRVIEHSQKGRTTSEGQAYSLFHALVANDPKRFNKILTWTNDNLAKGDLSVHLPAWLWGKDEKNQWNILDKNPASDADMWMAYALLEAGRLWSRQDYTQLGRAILTNIKRLELKELPNLGSMILPGPEGFQINDTSWRLNPSYLPIQLLRRFALEPGHQYWNDVIHSTDKLLKSSTPKGIIPDWVIYKSNGKFTITAEYAVGSYDAIRVYLWLGMLSDQDPLKSDLIQKLDFTCDNFGIPPEKVDTRTRSGSGVAPIGFKAALAPFFKSRQAHKCLHRVIRLIDRQWNQGLLEKKPVYYDQNLALFSLAWLENRYQFDDHGRLVTHWKKP